jgi:pyridinium-3,5-biscarboxylic acid mononucleotide sulfurtransferase
VDSAYLLHAALEALGPDRVLAVTGVSESLARRELEAARALAARLGASHRLVETRELLDPRYAANPTNRCYFCKSELYERLQEIAEAEGCDAIADGTNQDDTREVRPGRQAARERGVTSPLLEAGLTKRDIRELSRQAGLPTWDKPEMPCLSSRIPFGSPVEDAKLRQIELAEEALADCGLRGGRVRHHGDVARIELPPETLGRLADAVLRDRLVSAVRAAGFAYVTLDLEGYRRGKLHDQASRAEVTWHPTTTHAGSSGSESDNEGL